MYVKPKKHLGQHFLTDLSIAKRIADTLPEKEGIKVLEIGPGTGVLTQFLLEKSNVDLNVIELDGESVEYLSKNFPKLDGKIHFKDFLKYELKELYGEDEFMVIGNYPYNISSQIFFKVLEYRDQIPFVSGMLQKEVAERLASKPGKKAYGILSVLLQAYYDIEYLFTVPPSVFNPPPKVQSAVISLKRNSRESLPCDEKLFKTVVKTTFNQRRKTIRNSIRPLIPGGDFSKKEDIDLLTKRPEQLSVEEFVRLTEWLVNE